MALNIREWKKVSFSHYSVLFKIEHLSFDMAPTVVYALLYLLHSFSLLFSGRLLHLHAFVQEKAPGADNPASIAENIEKAKSVTQSRILTNEDFNKIKLRQVVKEVDGKGSKKRAFIPTDEGEGST